VRRLWGDELRAHRAGDSHGSRARARHGVGGAPAEAIAGFPSVTGVALPALTAALAAGLNFDRAAVQTLFRLMARLDDTNLLHRGGPEGLELARERARTFLAAGGAHAADWQPRALAVHREFVRLRLSPGGCADALAAAIFLHRLRGMET
jgi:triphosphoribosyl-dephospho-CoA synthase